MGFREDVDRIAPRLRRFARALVAGDPDNRAESADVVVQEAILRAVRSERLLDRSALAHWLYATVVDVYLLGLKRSAFVRPGAVIPHTEPKASEDAGHSTDPFRALAGALDVLPPEDRAALLLVSLEGCSFDETAAILRIPRAAVVQRLMRARTQMAAVYNAGHAAERGRHPHLRIVK